MNGGDILPFIPFEAPFGTLYIFETDGWITKLSLPGENCFPRETMRETPLLKKAALALSKYFSGARGDFDLPLRPEGTPFQKAVWAALLTIPYGETRSYRDIARAIQRPKAARAVGQANHNNPIAILIPCHRVIGQNGALTGYGGGLEIKRALLTLERARFKEALQPPIADKSFSASSRDVVQSAE